MRKMAFIVATILLASCCPPRPPEHKAYNGPTEPMETVVAAIERNNAAIPTLWAQLNYTATLVDPQKQTSDSVSGDGGLLYARPISLLLTGNKDIAGKVFQLGSNGDEFWVQIRADSDSFNYWWGHYANLDKPGCKPIPIRTDMVVQVLGIGLYQPNFLEQPVPVMRFDNDNDVYIFDRNVTNGDHWETQEEIWYDRATKHPRRVLLYDDIGRLVLKADLGEDVPIEIQGIAKDDWPVIARRYDLFFPDSGSRISFDFTEVALKHTLGHMTAPNRHSFDRIDPPEGKNNIIQIDADVDRNAE